MHRNRHDMKLYSILRYCCIILIPLTVNAQMPVEFIQNRGQWDGPFEYRGNTLRGDVFLQKDGFTYLFGDSANRNKRDGMHHGWIKDSVKLRYHAYKVSFEGAATPVITGAKEQKTYYNYFLGNDSKKWQSNIHPYLNINYKGLYKGIDMVVSSEADNIVYDFMVQPGADAGQIRLRYEGTNGVSLTKSGDLIIKTSVGNMQELKPYAYQYINGKRKEVPCRYELEGNELSFAMPRGYDKTQLLIIDPTVIFCTFTGSTADNWGFTATYDEMGNFYAGGIANGTGFPVSTGAFQIPYGGGSALTNSFFPCDMSIIKYNAAGNQRIWATYIGGVDNEQPHSMIVDKDTNLVISGRTYSNNYPVTTNAFDVLYNNGADIVVTKLNPSGNALLGSTYVGGSGDDGVNFNADEFRGGNLKHNYGDDSRSEVLVDNLNNIYVASCTKSNDFPITLATATQNSLNGTQDGVVFKMNPALTSMTWVTYIGGSNDDAAYVLAFDNAQGSLYVGGGTQSNNFPVTSGTLWSTFRGGGTDGFLLKFQNSANYPLLRGTFIGTPGYDQCFGVQVDVNDDVYTMGQTTGGTFPVTPGVFSNAGASQFIMKMDNTLTNNLQSTVIGSGNSSLTDISPVAFLVDTCENIYMSGWSGGLGLTDRLTGGIAYNVGTCNGMPTTPNAAQSTTDGYDFYFICLNKGMQNILYGSFFGRSSADVTKGEHVDGGTSRFDKNGIIYQAICGGCAGNGGASSPFPTTAGSWSPVNRSQNCNEAALKIDFQLGPVRAKATASPSARGCAPFTVQFNNTSNNGVNYWWDFGDNTPTSTTSNPTHTFTQYGTYTVRLAASNSNACIIVEDTAYLTIIVDTTLIRPSFNYEILDSCSPYTVAITNTSQYGSNPGAQAYTVFEWNFGDGNTYTGPNPPNHNYATDGTYTVTLTMRDSTSCNSPATATQTFTFKSTEVTASFTTADTVCRGNPVTFDNNTANGQTFEWNFGDGGTTTGSPVTHTFDSLGVYTVRLIAKNPNACNGIDTFIKQIVVEEAPTADFSWNPYPPKTNVPITFTNLSTYATAYLWDFGDSFTSTEVNPVHMYRKTGYFAACLTASNRTNCPAKVCKDVPTDIVPLADIPTGFSPNGDGKNDVLYVRGANIQTMHLQIYNRWGELVFETNDQNTGWDGTYKSKPQEMDAYAFVLDVTFFDGGTLHKQGNVTLLR